jgi:serine/threonine-protein kinase
LIYSEADATGKPDLWLLPLRPVGAPSLLFQTPYSESQAAVSPDGQWLAYVSDEPGREEVYVRALTGRGGRLQASTDGGVQPVWSRTGRELLYFSPTALMFGRRAMMAVEVIREPEFRLGAPHSLFEGAYGVGVAEYEYAGFSVSGDGERFLMLVPSSDPTATLGQLVVVTNWFDELKRRAPVRR